MKFLLIRSPVELKGQGATKYILSPSFYPPLGLLYIGAVIEEAGHSVEIIDLCVEDFSKERLKNILTSCDAVGMDIYTIGYQKAVDISNMIRELDPHIPLIIGGPHCTFFRQKSLLDVHKANVSIVGEGENVILDIIKSFQGEKKLSNINGIFYREKNKIKSGKPLRVINDLDSLPFPARHLIEKYNYGRFSGGSIFKNRLTLMMTSRGCPNHCLFCARYGNIIKNFGFRQRSAENVIGEIQEIDKKYGSIAIVDDNFLADQKRAHQIFDAIIESDIDLDLLIMGSRVDSADRKLYEKMKKAGVKYISFGIESGNQDVLDFYNKNITLQQIRKAVKMARDVGLTTSGTVIFGAPFETKQHIKNTINFVNSLPLDLVIFGSLHYEMGSPLWIKAVNDGKIKTTEFLVSAGSNRNLGILTQAELEKYTRMAYRRFYLRPKYVLDEIYRAFLFKEFAWLTNGLKFITSI